MWVSEKWDGFEVIDASDGEKLERWGKYFLVRPDPQVIWKTEKRDKRWFSPDARYDRSKTGGGSWQIFSLPKEFEISRGDITFGLKPMNFKHTGLFPEQSVNWDFASDIIKSAKREVSVLNLFAYTGAASVVCAKAGAKVCHVDASKGMTAWAKENCLKNGIENVRFIVDDCVKFVEREIRRNKTYDAVIMDPPSYGRGPNGEVWKLEDELYGLMTLCQGVLSEKPLFFILNSYTTGLSSGCMEYMLSVMMKQYGGVTEASEIGLRVSSNGLVLPCGSTARWYSKE